MSVYAVYGRAFRSAEWALRDVFATQDEADRHAETMVRESEQAARREEVVRPTSEAPARPESNGPPAPPELGDHWMGEDFHGWIESAVVEYDSDSEVPQHLPADGIVKVVSRHSHKALAEP